jgi:ribosomal protein S6--L-glutamate ligase
VTVRIGFLMPKYSRRSTSCWPLVVQAVTDLGAEVEIVHPLAGPLELTTLRLRHDLYVLRKLSGLSLSLAGALHELGAAIVNPYPATTAVHDKIVAAGVLQRAGVPVPATYTCARPADLAPLLDTGALIVKPYDGAGGHHVHLVRDPVELASVPHERRQPVFAQRYHAPDGPDLKLYGIGDRVFGVKKPYPRTTVEEKSGEPFTPSPELCGIALACARAFGVDVYGIDVIESGGRPYVVDVGSLPGYRGVPDAPRLLAEHLLAAAQRAARGDPVLSEASRS